MSVAVLLALLALAPAPRVPYGLGVEPSGPTTTFTFAAATQRLDTGIWFARGETVQISAAGEWTMWAGHFGKSNAIGHRYRVGLYGWGCLMARVGGGGEINIGTGRTFTVDASGPLMLYPNIGEAGMPEGDGELEITIRGGRPQAEVIAGLAARGRLATVPAAEPGLYSDIYVTAGQDIKVNAFGQWTMYEGGPPLGPDGDTRSLLPDGQPWGRLLMRIGGTDFSVGETYPVGSERTIRAKTSGLLHFFPAVGPYAGHPRAGELNVVVHGAEPADAARLAAARAAAEDYERALAFLRVAQYRRALMLPAAASSPELMRAAQQQAEYLAALEPDEDPASSGLGRIAGFAGQPLAELSHGYHDGVRAVDGLWLTVRGRRALCATEATAVGVGIARNTCVVLTGALPFKGLLPQAAVYPADGANGLAGEWNGLEEPPVVPPDFPRPYGLPVSLTAPGGIEEVTKAELRDRRDQPVPFHLVLPEPGADTVILVPLVRLNTSETYSATIELRAGGRPRTASWRFSIGQPTSLPMAAPRLEDPANPPIDLGRPSAIGSSAAATPAPDPLREPQRP